MLEWVYKNFDLGAHTMGPILRDHRIYFGHFILSECQLRTFCCNYRLDPSYWESAKITTSARTSMYNLPYAYKQASHYPTSQLPSFAMLHVGFGDASLKPCDSPTSHSNLFTSASEPGMQTQDTKGPRKVLKSRTLICGRPHMSVSNNHRGQIPPRILKPWKQPYGYGFMYLKYTSNSVGNYFDPCIYWLSRWRGVPVWPRRPKSCTPSRQVLGGGHAATAWAIGPGTEACLDTVLLSGAIIRYSLYGILGPSLMPHL